MSVFRLVAALALFAALAGAEGFPVISQVDRAVTAWLQRAVPAADLPAAVLGFIADPEVMISGLAWAGIVFLLLHDKRRGRGWLCLAAATIGVSLVTIILQNVIVHPVPPLALTRHIARRGIVLGDLGVVILGIAAVGAILLLLPNKRYSRPFLWLATGTVGISLAAVMARHLIVHFSDQIHELIGLYPANGFPSGHTVRTTLLAGTVFRRLPSLAAVIIVGMMASLVYLGVHWTSEVLGGFCLGWVCVEMARGLWGLMG